MYKNIFLILLHGYIANAFMFCIVILSKFFNLVLWSCLIFNLLHVKISKKVKKIGIIIILCIFVILCIVLGFKGSKKTEWNFAIIPHFMLNSEKVDQFYNFLKNEYYNGGEPDKIILISPNHFYTQTKEIQTICKSADVNYKSNIITLSSELYNLGIKCDNDGELFNLRGENYSTNEHGIGEHFLWINKYFPNSDALPIISPCFQFLAVEEILPKLENINGNILVIASVDFAHYQNEEQTLQHDKKSIETLESMELNQLKFIDGIDADCPICLYLIQYLANKRGKHSELRYRDSSSTILNQDMGEENTSRIFMRYK